jgi:hypothetical protein
MHFECSGRRGVASRHPRAQPGVHLGVTKCAAGTVDAKASEIVWAERRLHVVVAAALRSEAAKSPRIHFAALAGELALLLEIYGVVFDVQEHTSVRLLAALICVELAHRHPSDVVLVQMGACFPARFADALEKILAHFALAVAL